MPDLEKILIVRFSSLGDVILASPLFRRLRSACPNARIDVLVKSDYSDAVLFNPHLSSVITLKTSERTELREIKKNIRKTGYDLIIDIHNSLRSRYIRWGSGAVHTVVVNKRAVRRFLLVTFGWNFYGDIVPVAERYCEGVRKYGVSDDGGGLEIFLPEETRSTVASVMEKYRTERYDTVFGIGPAARHSTKRWPVERFVELSVNLAKKRRCRIFLFGGREDNDFCGDMAQMVNSYAGYSAAENFAGRLNFLETAAALDYCHAVITNDSALMHMAAARGKWVVGIFGSTVKEFGFFPYRAKSVIVERNDVRCRPCSHIGLEKCPKKHFRCMKEITAADVMNAVDEVLKN